MKSTRRIAAVFLLLGAPALWAQDAAPAGQGLRTELERTALRGHTEFALRLHDRLRADAGNLVASPISLRTALAMTYAGARVRTAEQMREVLRLRLEGEGQHQAVAGLARGLEADGVALRYASSLWAQEGLRLLPEFLDLQRTCYGAGTTRVDFGDTERARTTINAWVSERTAERIPELLDPGVVSGGTALVLVNAVHLDGAWEKAFTPESTVERSFRVPAAAGEDGEDGGAREVQVPTMFQHEEFAYLTGEDAAVLELPFRGGELSMVIVLPREREGLADLEAALTPELLEEWLDGLAPTQVAVFLPRFAVSTKVRLREELAAMGMPDAFDGAAADFSGMTGARDLWIDEVVHQAVLEVDEEGAEASAASAVMMKRGGGAMFRADHPFLFFVRDVRSGAILFLGRVVDPSEGGERAG